MSSKKLGGLKELLGSLPSAGFLASVSGDVGRKGDLSEEEQQAAALITALFDCVFLVAAADGTVSDDESAQLTEILMDLTGGKIDHAGVERAAKACAEKIEKHGFVGAIAKAAESIRDHEHRRVAFVMATGVSFVDGTVDPREESLFGPLAAALHIPHDEALDLLNQVASAMDEYEESQA